MQRSSGAAWRRLGRRALPPALPLGARQRTAAPRLAEQKGVLLAGPCSLGTAQGVLFTGPCSLAPPTCVRRVQLRPQLPLCFSPRRTPRPCRRRRRDPVHGQGRVLVPRDDRPPARLLAAGARSRAEAPHASMAPLLCVGAESWLVAQGRCGRHLPPVRSLVGGGGAQPRLPPRQWAHTLPVPASAGRPPYRSFHERCTPGLHASRPRRVPTFLNL